MSSSSARRHRVEQKSALPGPTLALFAAIAPLLLVASPSLAQAERSLADPPANVPRTRAMAVACHDGAAPACQATVLRAIDRARAAEGLGPLELPAGYGSLTTPQQLFVLADMERADRGLPGFTGLSAELDVLAEAGASSNSDPVGPPGSS
jgi:hypothetical protein